MSRAGVLAALVLLAASHAAARDLTAAEAGALETAVDAYEAATVAADDAVVVGGVPPKILAAYAAEAGVEVGELVDAMRTAMREEEDVRVTGYAMDLAAAERRETADGTPFVLIPTVNEARDVATGETVRLEERTAAVLDGGRWYFVPLDAETVADLRAAYPEFAGVDLPVDEVPDDGSPAAAAPGDDATPTAPGPDG